MKETIVKVKNSTGLHARPAALVVAAAGKFKSAITLKRGDREINIKSIISLLSLGVNQNDEIVIKAEGPDENEAVEKIASIINDLKE